MSQHPHKKLSMLPTAVEAETGGFPGLWPVSLTESVSSMFSERPCLKKVS